MTPASILRLAVGAVAAAGCLSLLPTAAAAPAQRPVEGRDYRIYVDDAWGTDLGACRGRSSGDAWVVQGLVDARGADRDDTRGGLVVRRNGRQTDRRWESGTLASGRYATGAVRVPRGDAYSIEAYVGIASAGGAVDLRASAIPTC